MSQNNNKHCGNLPQIVAICGSGAVGNHPLDADAWSGSSLSFFSEIRKRNALAGTVGGEISKFQKIFYALLNFSTDRALMVRRLYTDARYRNDLSKLMAAHVRQILFPPNAVAIQLGSMFNLNDVLPADCLRASYNDGNFVGGLSSPYYPKGKVSAKLIDGAIKYERNVVSGLQCVLTMSEYLRQSFIHDYGAAEEKVHNIGTGINLSPEVIEKSLALDLSVKNYDSQEILFIGTDILRKGGMTLLNAFRIVRQSFPKAVLHIVGPRTPVAGFESEPGVIWHGFLNKNEPSELAKLESLFWQSSFFVLPSLYEPLGIAPLESMIHGITAIVTNRWALRENVPAGKVGENVEPGNVEELAEKMRMLLSSPDTLQKYGSAARTWVTDNFRWEKVVDRLEKVLTR